MRSRTLFILRLMRDILLLPLVRFIPRNRKKIVFGAWEGRQFACNPKYLMKYVLSKGEGYECVWIGNQNLRFEVESVPGAKFARKGSLLSYWHFLTARFLVCNIDWRYDIADIPTCGRVIVINTNHGLYNKCCGGHQLDGNGNLPSKLPKRTGIRRIIQKLLVRFSSYLYDLRSWVSISSKRQGIIQEKSSPNWYSMGRTLINGLPRNDFLVKNKDNSLLKLKLKKEIASVLGVPYDCKWYLYVPTWRHADTLRFSFSTTSRAYEYEKLLQRQNAIMLEKQHPRTLEVLGLERSFSRSVCMISKEDAKKIDTQELLLCCDRLISDYSSIYFDYALLERPVIEFTYDYDFAAKEDFGFEFDLRESAPGPFAYTEDELLKYMSMDDNELLSYRTEEFFKHIEAEKGGASEALFSLIEKFSEP